MQEVKVDLSLLDAPEGTGKYEDLVFVTGTTVEFIIIGTDVYQKEGKPPRLAVKCKVMDGEHKGKPSTLWLSLKPEAKQISARRQLAGFLRSMFKREEIEQSGGNLKLSTLPGMKFKATAEKARSHGGRTYQDWADFTNTGPATLEEMREYDTLPF